MLFDLDTRGHHAGYIQHLITYWQAQDLSGTLDIVVVPEFLRQHSSVVEVAAARKDKNINFITITLAEESNLKTVNSSVNRLWRSFQEWQLIKKYTQKLEATHCLLMFFDAVFSRMCLGINPPCPISGIFFRPTSHYSNFSNYQPSSSEHFWELREKFGLSRILKAGYFDNLFSLDPLAVEHFSKLDSKSNIVYLPDPVQIYDTSPATINNLKQELGIEADRKVCLLFGALSKRKGIYKLLEAIKLLSPALAQKLCLLLIGPVDVQEKSNLSAIVADISQSQPVQIICYHQFVIETEIQPYFEIADLVLAPYQRHIGMSAILVRAAAAKKPVLSSDYGLMGEITRMYQLGITIDSSIPQEITDGLTRFLSEPAANFCNYAQIKHFADQNKAEQFAKVIFENIL